MMSSEDKSWSCCVNNETTPAATVILPLHTDSLNEMKCLKYELQLQVGKLIQDFNVQNDALEVWLWRYCAKISDRRMFSCQGRYRLSEIKEDVENIHI